jgi:hypothetical protein
MRNRIRTTLGILGVSAIALVLVAAPASAEGNTQLSGVGVFVGTDECPERPSLVSVRKVPENKSSSILSGAAGCSAAQSKDADQASFLDQDASFDSISQKARNSAQDAFAAHYKGFRTRTSLYPP